MCALGSDVLKLVQYHSVDVFDLVDVYTLKSLQTTIGVTGQLYVASLSAEIKCRHSLLFQSDVFSMRHYCRCLSDCHRSRDDCCVNVSVMMPLEFRRESRSSIACTSSFQVRARVMRATAPSFQDGRQPPSWILSNRK